MKYIAFEGVDGLGKSTQAQLVAQRLNARLIAEPSALGQAFKQLTLGKLHPRARMFMFLADRAQLFAELEANSAFAPNATHLIADRSLISHLAYAIDCEASWLWELNMSATNHRSPDAVVYFAGDAALMRQRLAGKELDALESDMDYLQQVARNYEKVLSMLKVPILRIDAAGAKEQICEQITSWIQRL